MASTNPTRTYTPTDEQDDAIGRFLAGSHLVIEAGAGTGKTSTLVMLAEHARGRRGQYIAFNRSIVNEAGDKLPASAVAKTAHQLAFRAKGRTYAHRLDSKRQPSAKVAAQLRLDPVKITIGDQASFLSPGYLAGVAMRAIGVFCNSADPEPTRRHIGYIEGIDMPDAAGRLTYTNNDLVRDMVAPALGRAWADLTRPDGSLRFTHDCYLKMWELDGPRVAADYLMFDEAQDASPVMLSIVQQQAPHGTQLVYVGDTQQQIYGWRGAINALANVEDAERTFLTQSFRFGPAVAEVANRCLAEVEAELRVKGLPSIDSYVAGIDEPRAVMCRTNAEAVGRVIAEQAAGRRPYLVGEGKEVLAFARAVDQLRAEGWTSHAELACFTTWGQVQDYVDQDPQGSELKLLVRLVEQYGTDTIIEALSHQPPERSCDQVVSTAHKAKGREWPTVQLAGDFPDPQEEGLSPEEWRLLYVAVTRAEHGLDIEGVTALAPKQPARVAIDVPDTAEALDTERLPLESCVCGEHFDCPDGWHYGDDLPCACTADCALTDEDDDEEGYGYQRPPLG
jgi:hypothetical protein